MFVSITGSIEKVTSCNIFPPPGTATAYQFDLLLKWLMSFSALSIAHSTGPICITLIQFALAVFLISEATYNFGGQHIWITQSDYLSVATLV